MAFTVNEIGTLTIETGGGFVGDWASGWSATNYYHITDLDTAGSAQLHGFVLFYKGTQTDTASGGTVAIPLWGDKDNTGGLSFGVDNGVVAIGDGTTIHRGSTAVNDDAWHSIIFSYGETTVKAYVDGTLEVDITPSSSVMTTSIINAIGHAAGSVAGPAGIDGIQIYDRYLFDFMVADFQANIYAEEPVSRATDSISTISGLIARYTPESFNESSQVWEDIVGTNHTTNSRGTVSTRNSSDGGFKTLFGSTNDGLLFPTTILPATYTLFHVTRYSGAEYRILQGNGNNWLSGHWSGNAGVAYHEGWLTSQTDYNGVNWGIYTDKKTYFRDSGTVRATSGGGASTNLGLNYGNYPGEYSDWECAEIIVFNRELSDSEIISVENTLASYYPVTALGAGTSSGGGSSSATFILENLITSNQKTHTLENYKPINTDFVPIAVQTNDTMAIMEAQLGNTTLEDDIIFTKVYMNHNLDNEEDKLAHRVHVVVPFGFLQLVREKWS